MNEVKKKLTNLRSKNKKDIDINKNANYDGYHKTLTYMRIYICDTDKGKEVEPMEQSIFISAQEVADMLGISKSKAYRIVRELNEELEAKGFITVAGRVSRKFFEEKVLWSSRLTVFWNNRRFQDRCRVETVRFHFADGKEKCVWQHIKMKNVEHGMFRSTIMTGLEMAKRKLELVEAKLERATTELHELQKEMESLVEHARQSYDRYSRVAVTDRQYELFEDVVQLKQENEQLKAENWTLREKLQKAYDFMKQFTISGINLLERFLESVGERVQNFTEHLRR